MSEYRHPRWDPDDWHPDTDTDSVEKSTEADTRMITITESDGTSYSLSIDDAKLIEAWLDPNSELVQEVARQLRNE